MSQQRIQKGIALYSEQETDLWEQVEEVVREDYDAPNVREGEIAAQVFASYLGAKGPLDGRFECPMCGEYVDMLPRHIESTHNSEENHA